MIAGRSCPDCLVCVVVAEREIGREASDIVADGGVGRLDGLAREPVALRSGEITPIDALIVEDQLQRVAPEVDLLFLEKDLAAGLPDSRVVVGQRAVVVVVVEITPFHLKIGRPVEIMAVKQVRRIFAELLQGLVVHGGGCLAGCQGAVIPMVKTIVHAGGGKDQVVRLPEVEPGVQASEALPSPNLVKDRLPFESRGRPSLGLCGDILVVFGEGIVGVQGQYPGLEGERRGEAVDSPHDGSLSRELRLDEAFLFLALDNVDHAAGQLGAVDGGRVLDDLDPLDLVDVDPLERLLVGGKPVNIDGGVLVTVDQDTRGADRDVGQSPEGIVGLGVAQEILLVDPIDDLVYLLDDVLLRCHGDVVKGDDGVVHDDRIALEELRPKRAGKHAHKRHE